jgi:hypothetical protein
MRWGTTPYMCPASLAWDKISAKELAMKSNRIGESGSPWSTPLEFLKYGPTSPLTFTAVYPPDTSCIKRWIPSSAGSILLVEFIISGGKHATARRKHSHSPVQLNWRLQLHNPLVLLKMVQIRSNMLSSKLHTYTNFRQDRLKQGSTCKYTLSSYLFKFKLNFYCHE